MSAQYLPKIENIQRESCKFDHFIPRHLYFILFLHILFKISTILCLFFVKSTLSTLNDNISFGGVGTTISISNSGIDGNGHGVSNQAAAAAAAATAPTATER